MQGKLWYLMNRPIQTSKVTMMRDNKIQTSSRDEFTMELSITNCDTQPRDWFTHKAKTELTMELCKLNCDTHQRDWCIHQAKLTYHIAVWQDHEVHFPWQPWYLSMRLVLCLAEHSSDKEYPQYARRYLSMERHEPEIEHNQNLPQTQLFGLVWMVFNVT